MICFSITHCNNWSIAVWVYRLKYDVNFSYVSVDFHLFVFNRQKEPDSFWMRCLLDAVTTHHLGRRWKSHECHQKFLWSNFFSGYASGLAFAWKLNFKCIFTILCCSFYRIYIQGRPGAGWDSNGSFCWASWLCSQERTGKMVNHQAIWRTLRWK